MSLRTARYQGEALAEAFGFKKPPVNVQLIAKRLGLKIVHADLGDDISGLLISKADSTVIAVQESDSSKPTAVYGRARDRAFPSAASVRTGRTCPC